MQNNTIYTLGYQRWTPAALQATCAELGAALLDIRYSPRSQRPEWTGEALARFLGATYTHCGALGNRNYKGGEIELAAPTKALPFVRNMLASQPIILLCVCADYRICHRTVAATWLAQRLGNPVAHLEPQPRAEAGPLTFTGEPLAYWREEAARGCAASLGRLAALCATRGASYDATMRGLSVGEFFQHYQFIIKDLLRVTKPGRNTCVHVQQIAAMLERDGYIGIKDFRGDVIRAYQEAGWIYHGEVCIDKDPQAQAIRTKAKALMFVQLHKDSSWSRPALADYILIFRKPGENAVTISPDITNDEWIQWARPIWYGIEENDTLQYTTARDAEDERHICPLQLGTIERCIRLWSKPGETVLDPFTGIGSTGWEAIRLGRAFIGCELKPSYWRIAVQNMEAIEAKLKTLTLFDLISDYQPAQELT